MIYSNMSKFRLCDRLCDMSVCARSIDRIFLRNTLRVIQLSVLHYIFIGYEPELARRSL